MVDLEKYILDRELFNKLPGEKELIDNTKSYFYIEL